MAIAAVLSAACLAPAASFGYSIDLQGPNAGTLNTSSTGDALIYPYYTVAKTDKAPNGTVTNISITNTSNTQVVLTKIRIREQEHSMDVLDFFVVLSPNDKFDFWLSLDAATNRPKMNWDDKSCVVGPQTPGMQVFREAAIPFVMTDEQMHSGHIELMGLVDLSNTILGPAATHTSNGTPANCALVQQVLSDPIKTQALNVTLGGLKDAGHDPDAGNVLMGRYVITVPNVGIEAGGDAVALRDSNLAEPRGGELGFHLASQSSAMCMDLAPIEGGSRNCKNAIGPHGNLYSWDQQEESHPHLAELQTDENAQTGLIAFQKGLHALYAAGDWSNNAANHVGFDWVVTFPDKYIYMDCNEYLAGAPFPLDTCKWAILESPRIAPGEAATPAAVQGVWYDNRDGDEFTDWSSNPSDLVMPISMSVYNTEERGIKTITDVSPTPPGRVQSLVHEVNVFTLNNLDLGVKNADMPASQIQSAARRGFLGFHLGADSVRGWGELKLNWENKDKPGAVLGINFTTRATEDPTINNGSLTDLQKY